ncbi:DUF6794 domain-containing protein [Qipengyuania nanhaisediminis]|uniref:DUF6794 domain-containing protein n=1 Tax=Qipengyuania nanhaisediminis TaxID=604088 RepID=UPI0038B23BF4
MRQLFVALALGLLAFPVQADDSNDPVATALLACEPQDLDAAVSCLETHLPVDHLAKLREDGLALDHFGLGMWIRNNWGLWADGALGSSMRNQGFLHPDDMSSVILESLVARLRDEEYDLEARVAHYKNYWDRANQREEVSCGGENPSPSRKCFVDGNGTFYSEKAVND